MDDAWHPFASSPLSWYRVWRKKIVQRATFENEREEAELLPQMSTIEPLPDLASVSGFREELAIVYRDSSLFVRLPLGYAPSAFAEFERALRTLHIRSETEGELIFALLPLDALTREALLAVTEQQMAVRLYFQAVTAAGVDARALEAARDGFQRMHSGDRAS